MTQIRKGALWLWRIFVTLFFITGFVTVFFAGAGAFFATTDYDTHQGLGHIMLLASLFLLLLALLAWPGKPILLGSLGLFVLMIVQVLLGGFGEDEPWVGAFHPVNALFIIGLAGFLTGQAWRTRRELPPPEGPEPVQTSAS